MVQASRLLLPLSVGLLASLALAGCLSELVTDPMCPPTAVGADWTQPGAWDAFPTEGPHGVYNVSLQEGEGHPFEDSEWGSLVLNTIQWDASQESNYSRGVYELEHTGELTITVPESHETNKLQDGFLGFVDRVSEMDEQEARERSHDLLNTRVQTRDDRAESNDASFSAQAVEEEPHVSYRIMVEGPFRFEALYDELLDEAGMQERPDPWSEEYVELGDWRIHFPVPVQVATHTEEAGRLLQVDARDRMEFQWDPPAGVGNEALMAGIHRSLSDLDLPPPSDAESLDIHTATC